MTKFFAWILSSRLTTLLGFAAAVIGLTNNPEFAGVVPEDWAARLAVAGAILATLARGLTQAMVDADGNGVPDIFDKLLGTPTSRRGATTVLLLGCLVLVAILLVAFGASALAGPLPLRLGASS